MCRHKVVGSLVSLLTLFSLGGAMTVDAQTLSGTVRNYTHKTHTYFQRHPYQKTGLIGAGVGAAVGGLFFRGEHHGGRNALRGAAIGGAAGLGYEYLKKRGTIR